MIREIKSIYRFIIYIREIAVKIQKMNQYYYAHIESRKLII